MTAPTEREVVDYVTVLENSYQPFRTQTQNNVDVHNLRRLPRLPKDLARQEAVYILSQDTKHEAKVLSAFQLAMQTEITVTATKREPGGVVKAEHKRMADALEPAHAIVWHKLNPNRLLEARTVWSQMIKPVAAIALELGPIETLHPAERFPWSAFDIEIDGCGWHEKDGVPTLFGRHYKQLVREAVRSYSGRNDGPNAGQMLNWTGKKVAWVPLSADYSPRMPPPTMSGQGGKLPEVDIMWLDDGEWISCVAVDEPTSWSIGPVRMGRNSPRSGTMLWQGENPFGRVSVFLCSGDETAQRAPEEARCAYLDELITIDEQTSTVMSIIATAARNRASARNYVRPDPDSIKEYMQRNNGQLPPDLQFKDGNLPYVMGEINEIPSNVDPGLMAELEELERRRERYSNSAFTQLTSPEIVSQSTASAWLGAWDAGNALISAPVGRFDVMRRQMLEAIEYSIKWLDKKHGARFSSFDLTGGAGWLRTGKGAMSGGTAASLSAQMLDFPHEINVTTKSHSIAQQQQMFELVLARMAPLPDGRPGVGTYDDLMQAIDESDPTARQQTMAEEQMMGQYGTPYLKDMVIAAIDKQVELDTGLRLPLLAAEQQQRAMDAAAAQASANAPPPGPNRMAAPTTEPVVGGGGGAPAGPAGGGGMQA